jgi:hypothetical protein
MDTSAYQGIEARTQVGGPRRLEDVTVLLAPTATPAAPIATQAQFNG